MLPFDLVDAFAGTDEEDTALFVISPFVYYAVVVGFIAASVATVLITVL